MRPRTRDATDHAALQLIFRRTACPSNDAIAAAIGARGAAAGAACLKRLEASGQIRIERPVSGWRVVIDPEFGIRREGEDA
ncbi:hypothetical protein [Novosphingobium resinovorum]|uniref:Uncharacterized protein n=1 Tax=Novosphingobium resinovorum TaxID=158500 RepID=A0A1D8A519_9SPHN|nr:hypothetical protein [Novosphingobium resinovorum]AOR77200.1 hypothetical protein BES08_10900 [Novosphingobium resinovorum]